MAVKNVYYPFSQAVVNRISFNIFSFCTCIKMYTKV